jgi:hypothetical protein
MNRTSRTRSSLTRALALALLGTLAVASVGCSSRSAGTSSSSAPQSGMANLRADAPAVDSAKSGAAPSPGYPAVAEAGSVGGGSPAQPSTVPKATQMIIRNANMRLEVTKVIEVADKLRALAKQYGGVIANFEVSTEAGSPAPQPLASDRGVSSLSSGQPYNGSVTILVPTAKFDAFTEEARKLGKVLTYRTDDQNVTAQHVDMKARLINLKAEEARLRSFFDAAKNVNEMLAIERELARVRGDIESLSAQIVSLERQAAMSTLTVELTEPKALVRPAGVDWGIGTAITDGVQGFAEVLGFLIRFILAILPIAVLVAAIVLFIRWLVLRGQRKRAAMPAQPVQQMQPAQPVQEQPTDGEPFQR